jgi:protein-S-isoprenylcysteine O-methyltransferase Ste14|tara:strand:+ start:1267 stop:1647 length:381 start_codon:yes stop_codon:yes gene_type:complete
MPQLTIVSPLSVYAGYGFILSGAILLTLAVLAFVRARTTVNPLAPEQAQALVTTGLYRFTRNPMYLAMAFILIGGTLALSNIAALAAPAIFVGAITMLQIKPEERALQSVFGDEFSTYRNQTRRWL